LAEDDLERQCYFIQYGNLNYYRYHKDISQFDMDYRRFNYSWINLKANFILIEKNLNNIYIRNLYCTKQEILDYIFNKYKKEQEWLNRIRTFEDVKSEEEIEEYCLEKILVTSKPRVVNKEFFEDNIFKSEFNYIILE
jgi:hypothetical protein